MNTSQKTASPLIKRLREGSVSPYRLWYNEWVQNNAKGAILDVGKSRFWDYGADTIDTNADLKPTFTADILYSSISNNIYDTILCNGMFEVVSRPQRLVTECSRILAIHGLVIFGFVGKTYYPYKKKWRYYTEGCVTFPLEIVEKKDFEDKYHFIICRKNPAKTKPTLADTL